MATDHNFRIKNGLEVGGQLIVNSSGQLVVADVTSNLDFADNVKATFGNGSDLQIYHDGSNSYIDEAGTGELRLRSNEVELRDMSNEVLARFSSGGSSALFYDNAEKFKTHSLGAEVEGQLWINDSNTHIKEGSSNSLRVQTPSGYIDVGPHNTSYAHMGTDRPQFYFNKKIVIGEDILTSYDADLQLQRVNSTKITLTSTGANVTGDLAVSGDLNITGDINSVSVTDLDIVDKTITVGQGQSASNSTGSGLIVSGANASMLWDNTDDRWEFNKDIYTSGNIDLGNARIYASGDSNSIHIHAPAAIIGPSTTTTSNPSLGTSAYRFDGVFSSDANFSGSLTFATQNNRNALNMNNNNIIGVNRIDINDPGPNEGINFSGGNIKIYESPDDLTTNSAGNLQIVYGSTRRLTVNNSGIDVNGTIGASGLLSLGGTGSLGAITTNQKILANFDGGYSTNNSAQNKVIGFIGTTVSSLDIFNSTYGTSGELSKNFYLGISTGNSYFNNAKFVIVQGGVERFNMAQGGNSTFSGTISSGAITSTGTVTATGGNSTQWNTAYTYSQVGHLPLTGGTLTGTLNAGAANFTSAVKVGGWLTGASNTNTLFSHTLAGTIIQTPSNTNDAGGSFYIRDSLGVVHFTLNTNTNVSTFAGTISSGAITSSGSLTLSSNSISVNTRSLLARDTNGLNIGTTNATTAISIDNSANVTMPYNLTVSGNLTINGTTTTLNTATLDVEDKNITLNYGTGDTSGSANGAGITIQDAVNSTTDATILWNAGSDQFDFSNKINVSGDLQAQNIYALDVHVLNAAGNGWHEWATRNNNKVDLNVGTISSGVITATGGNSTNWNTAYTVANAALPKAGGTMTGALVGTTATFFKDATAGTNALNILGVNNGNGTGITFSDNGTPAASASGQNGYLTYYHGDGSSYGSGNAFILSSSETTTTILADGKLMYKEGIYSKPASGTGAGTRKDANWDTAYGWGNHASAGYLTSFDITTQTDSKYLRSNASDTYGNHTLTIQGSVRSTNNANTSGPNFNVSTTNKSTSEYAYRVDRSGSVVGGVRIDGRLIGPDAVIGGATVSAAAIGNWNTAYGWGNYASAPNAPSITSTTAVNETIEIVFAASTSTGNTAATSYEVWSDGGTGDFSLIAKIPYNDIASSMSVVDSSFDDSGTIAYRVYAIRHGAYSTAATTSRAFSMPSLDVSSMSVVPDTNSYYIQYDLPETRFLDHVEIYKDAETTSNALARSGAALVYSGRNPSYKYNIGSSDMDKYHQFWVEVVTV